MASDTQTGLSSAERDALGEIVATMIPADRELGMPGADDTAILTDIAGTLGRDLSLVREAIATLGAQGFATTGRDGREAMVNDFHARGGAAAAALGRAVLGAYYRDDRVLVALGHEARAPFPKGYVVEQGDWSLLDAVRGREPFWRKDR